MTPEPESYDGFISYSHTDAAWVQTLAENLHRADLDVWFDQWETSPGDVLARALDRGLAAAANGILVVGRDALDKPFVLEEYAAVWHRAVTEGIRLIPVVIADVKLPPLLASRIWIDFRDEAVYQSNLERLVNALKNQKTGPPDRDSPIIRPGDT